MFSPLNEKSNRKRVGLTPISEYERGSLGSRMLHHGSEDSLRHNFGKGDESMLMKQLERLADAVNDSDIRASRLRVEMRNDKGDTDLALQDLRSLLSDEVMSRKKNIQRAANAFEKLNALAAKTDKDVGILANEVEERFHGIDTNMCKITGDLTDQIISLQGSTKNAMQTLQMEHKAVATKLGQVSSGCKL